MGDATGCFLLAPELEATFIWAGHGSVNIFSTIVETFIVFFAFKRRLVESRKHGFFPFTFRGVDFVRGLYHYGVILSSLFEVGGDDETAGFEARRNTGDELDLLDVEVLF